MGWWCWFGGWVILDVISNLHSSDSGVLIGHGSDRLAFWRSFPTFIALIPGCLLDMAMIGSQLEVISNLHNSDSGVLIGHGGVALVVGLYWRSFPTFIALILGFLVGMAMIGWQLEGISNLPSSDSGVLSRHGGVALVVGLYWRSFPTFIALIPGVLVGWWCWFGGWVILEVFPNLPSFDSMILSGHGSVRLAVGGHFQPS